MVKGNKVLIEKFKGFEIYYDKDQERFTADKPKLEIHFESARLWEIKGCIKETRTEEIDKEYFIISGYSDQQIAKINLMTKNTATERCKYKILEDTKYGYDVGRTHEDTDIPKLYDVSKVNMRLYSEVKKLQSEIEKIEAHQYMLVKELA